MRSVGHLALRSERTEVLVYKSVVRKMLRDAASRYIVCVPPPCGSVLKTLIVRAPELLSPGDVVRAGFV
jgi:hypothetical protein